MINIQLDTFHWLQLPMETRNKLRELFHIPKSQGVILENETVKSDGTTYQDLSALTLEKMQTFLFGSPLPQIFNGQPIPLDGESLKPGTLVKIGDITVDITNFAQLFDAVIAKIEADKKLEVKEEKIDPLQLQLEEWTANLNRLKGDAVSKDKLVYLVEIARRVFEIKSEIKNEPIRLPAKRGRPKKVK